MLLALTSDVSGDKDYTIAASDSKPPISSTGLAQTAALNSAGAPTGSDGQAPTAPSAPTGSGSLEDFLLGVGDTAKTLGDDYAAVRDSINGQTATVPVNTAGTTVRSSVAPILGLVAFTAVGVGLVWFAARASRKGK